MPKEITHWTICEKSIEAFNDLNRVQSILKSNTNLFFLGAVILDSPYYARGIYKDQFRCLADLFHGSNGENTILPVVNLISKYEGKYFEGLLAFCLGIITHIVTDSEYHPFIYYYTGNYYDINPQKRDLAVYYHRLLEAHLDIFYMKQLSKRKEYKLENFINEIEIPYNELERVMNHLFTFCHHRIKSEEIMKVARNHSKFQKKYINLFFSKTIKIIDVILRGRISKYSSLFYPSINQTDVSFFCKEITYIHPVTSCIVTTSLDKIEISVISKIHNIANKINSCNDKADVISVLETTIGPSLETGLVGSKVSDMINFSNNLAFIKKHTPLF